MHFHGHREPAYVLVNRSNTLPNQSNATVSVQRGSILEPPGRIEIGIIFFRSLSEIRLRAYGVVDFLEIGR